MPKYWHLYTRRNWTLQDLYDRAGLSPKLQDLLAGQSGDYGLPPDQIALITHTSLVWDYSEGAYYPQHHFKHLVDSIVSMITKGGGVVEFSTPVQHIEVENHQVVSIYAGAKTYQADNAYISDLDPKLTVKLMYDSRVLSKQEYRRITNYEYSASAFNIYLGLDSGFDPSKYGIGNWNVWYYPNSNLNQAYQQQLQGNLEHPWIFLSCPTLKSHEPGMAPDGHHVLEITLDNSLEAMMVFDSALSIAQPGTSEMLLVHFVDWQMQDVSPWIGIGTLYDVDLSGERYDWSREHLKRKVDTINDWLKTMAQKANQLGIKYNYECHIGNCNLGISDRARDWGADVLVIGRRGHRNISEIFLGSVSNYVIHHAPCSVLVAQGSNTSKTAELANAIEV